MAKPVPIGARGHVEERVKFQHTLTAWRAELPPVLSTQHMIEWMDGAGFDALLPFCEGDEISVGTAINVDHRAATGIDVVVKAEAVLESFDGRFYTFKGQRAQRNRGYRTRNHQAGHRQQEQVRREATRQAGARLLSQGFVRFQPRIFSPVR